MKIIFAIVALIALVFDFFYKCFFFDVVFIISLAGFVYFFFKEENKDVENQVNINIKNFTRKNNYFLFFFMFFTFISCNEKHRYTTDLDPYGPYDVVKKATTKVEKKFKWETSKLKSPVRFPKKYLNYRINR